VLFAVWLAAAIIVFIVSRARRSAESR
jgi:hypothetical protein